MINLTLMWASFAICFSVAMDVCYRHLLHRGTWEAVSGSFQDCECYCLVKEIQNVVKSVIKTADNTVIVFSIYRDVYQEQIWLHGMSDFYFYNIQHLLDFTGNCLFQGDYRGITSFT